MCMASPDSFLLGATCSGSNVDIYIQVHYLGKPNYAGKKFLIVRLFAMHNKPRCSFYISAKEHV